MSVQADWFAEPSLTPADRNDLQALLVREKEGPHILAGVGDLLLKDLRGVGAADWTALAEYGRGRRNAGETVRLIDPAPRPLADRVALGNTLIALKAVIPGATLGASVSEAQLLDVHASALVPTLAAYFATFHPNLEMTYEPAAGARPLEFQNMLDLLRGPGTGPFAALLGRVRDLHRFPPAMLTNLVHNFADHSRSRPVHLILHGSHDAAGAFQQSVGLMASLVADARNLHLMLEGRDTIADLTAAVPGIAAAYGQPDATGTPRIGQVMIAGHGEARSVDLAQNDRMDLDPANAKQKKDTEDLINTLMSNMDPATARVVYAGCLVGSSPVAAGLPAAGIAADLATNRNLATVTDQAAVAHGIAPGRTQGARASVALGRSSSFMDAAGNLSVQYPFDPNAYGNALTYVATGHEPEGLFRAAVEVAATAGEPAAEAQLRTRLTMGVTAGHEWFDEIIVAGIGVALDGVALGAGVPGREAEHAGPHGRAALPRRQLRGRSRPHRRHPGEGRQLAAARRGVLRPDRYATVVPGPGQRRLPQRPVRHRAGVAGAGWGPRCAARRLAGRHRQRHRRLDGQPARYRQPRRLLGGAVRRPAAGFLRPDPAGPGVAAIGPVRREHDGVPDRTGAATGRPARS